MKMLWVFTARIGASKQRQGESVMAADEFDSKQKKEVFALLSPPRQLTRFLGAGLIRRIEVA